MPRKSASRRQPKLAGSAPMTREQYERVLPPLRDALLSAQKELQDRKTCALAVIVTGTPTAGRSEIVNQFLEWLDPKRVRVHALEKLRAISHAWPTLWRYWNALPARGEIAFFFRGWYEDYMYPALRHPRKAQREKPRAVERIRQLEAMLQRDGVQVLKLHLTVSREVQDERIRKLRADKLTRWRVTHEERWLARHYAELQRASEACIRLTGQPGAEWHVIDGSDPQARSFAAGSILLDALERGLRKQALPSPKSARPAAKLRSVQAEFRGRHAGKPVVDENYDVELEQLRGRFALLTRRGKFRKHGAVFVFEGMDAAGKGGAIRRLTGALDARQYTVVPVAAPSAEELSYPYLWRFWRHVPRRGEIAIFDRSWYGRVLVERVRGFAAPRDWQRAYDEINEFERQLIEHGLIVHKFWLSVSREEQLRRFRERDNDKLKRFKVDPEDWANRRHYGEYQLAAREMIRRTSTDDARWTVVEADDKKYARLKVLQTVCESIERTLD